MTEDEKDKTDLSISMNKAQLYSFLTPLPAVIPLGLLYLWRWELSLEISLLELALFYTIGAVLFCVGVVAHEFIHGLTWKVLGRKPRDAIEFGVQWKALTPYAHCKEPLRARAYRWGAAMPGLALGILPSVAGVLTGNGWVMLFGIIFTLAAGADVIILWLIRSVGPEQLVEDHPSKAGCYVLDGEE